MEIEVEFPVSTMARLKGGRTEKPVVFLTKGVITVPDAQGDDAPEIFRVKISSFNHECRLNSMKETPVRIVDGKLYVPREKSEDFYERHFGRPLDTGGPFGKAVGAVLRDILARKGESAVLPSGVESSMRHRNASAEMLAAAREIGNRIEVDEGVKADIERSRSYVQSLVAHCAIIDGEEYEESGEPYLAVDEDRGIYVGFAAEGLRRTEWWRKTFDALSSEDAFKHYRAVRGDLPGEVSGGVLTEIEVMDERFVSWPAEEMDTYLFAKHVASIAQSRMERQNDGRSYYLHVLPTPLLIAWCELRDAVASCDPLGQGVPEDIEDKVMRLLEESVRFDKACEDVDKKLALHAEIEAAPEIFERFAQRRISPPGFAGSALDPR